MSTVRAATAQGEHKTYTGALLRGPKFLPAWLLEETDPFVQAALQVLRAAGLDPQFGAYRFCTNAADSAGTAGVPTIGFGPGREADAHVINERLAVDALLAARRGCRASSRQCWASRRTDLPALHVTCDGRATPEQRAGQERIVRTPAASWPRCKAHPRR